MKLSKAGAAFIAAHEGWRARAYRDPVGILTIGYGFTWRSQAFKRWWSENRPGQTFGPASVITRAEGDEILRLLVDEEYGAAVNRFLGSVKVRQNVFDAMASVAFNAGPGSLGWTWAKLARDGNLSAAADRLKVTAVTAKGKRLPGLVRRRAEEAALLEHGNYAGHGVSIDKPDDAPLARGDRGPRVREAQTRLVIHGIDPGPVDGVFGVGTEAAVLAFQAAKGLAADGIIGPQTWAAMAREPQKPTQADFEAAFDEYEKETETAPPASSGPNGGLFAALAAFFVTLSAYVGDKIDIIQKMTEWLQ